MNAHVDDHPSRRLNPAGSAGAVGGDFRCHDCGYAVSVMRELPSCPMCGASDWEPLPRSLLRPSRSEFETAPVVSERHIRR
ncbi:MAG: hypothetical protein ACTHNU_16715 [Gaiellales bacterium]